jgi:hypothetical protein
MVEYPIFTTTVGVVVPIGLDTVMVALPLAEA